MRELTVWALFDTGKGAYSRALSNRCNIISIGIDKTNKSTAHFINLNLADYGYIFGNTTLFDTLDQLPKPDIILASPPCESWSIASAMKGGNAFYKWEKGEKKLEIRTDKEITSKNHTPFKRYPDKTLYTRVNGELCAFNTLQIIKRYAPNVWVIENPQSSRLFNYLEYYHGMVGYRNISHYNNYDDNFPKKPTCFYSNIEMSLNSTNKKARFYINPGQDTTISTDYNIRSDIPDELTISIFNQAMEAINNEYKQKTQRKEEGK